MSEWKEKTLGELSIRVSSGLTPLKSNKEFWENPIIPWLKTDQLGEKYIFDTNTKISKEALEQTSLRIYPENTISIAMYGEGKTRGNLSIIKAPMTTNQACCNIELDSKLADVEYVYYYLKTQYDALRKLSSGVRKNLNSNDIKNYKIYIPESVSFQRSIVRILTSLDNKISVNNQINQELEAMAKTLYDYWFVQFDFPDQNGKPYKSSGGKMVYNPELKREIPEGWGVEKLGDISQYVSEKVDSFELNIENYVGTDNMIADMGGIELTTSIPKSGTSTKFSVGDILISNIRPYFKKIWLSDRTGGCSADVLCIRTNRTIPKEFVYATLARDDFFNYDVAGSKGSKMPRGDKKHIMEYPIVFEFGIAEQYSKIVKPIYEAVHENNNQNQELTQLRDWLLPMLMNGQVKVEDFTI